jgi:hypothetical protein
MNAPSPRNSIGPALALILTLLAGCAKQIEAPYETGVCWKMEFLEGGKVRFNKLADHRPNLESCAAALEGLRIRNLGLGQNEINFIGAYQGNFLFLNQYGVFTAPSLTAARYPALVRTGDGRLAVPGSVVP